MRRHAIGSILTLVVSLILGFLISQALTGFLAIEFKDKDVPSEPPSVVDAVTPAPIAALGSLTVPDDADPLFAAARTALADASSARETTADFADVTVRLTPGDGNPEAFEIAQEADVLVVTATDRRGAAQGLFRIADRLRSGHDWADLDGLAESPALEHRFVDTGAVGVEPDPAAYQAQSDYQHTSGALERVLLPESPYIDADALAEVDAEWRQFINHSVAMGYNGVFIGGFLEYVNFDRYGDGLQIHPADSPYRARQDAMKEQVGQMWRYAHDMGMRVVFKTDMLALSDPLEAYLTGEGIFDAADPRLWEVYRAGLDELLGDLDWVDGLMIRIGEGGSIYNHEGSNYYSALKVTDSAAVRRMLDVATEVAAQHDDTIYFRTWSVGVGDVGDMHTNPETYERLFDGYSRDNLVVSTKFTQGDFDSYLPLNPTLEVGGQQRIVELQGRREFEAFSSFPNDVGPAHQTALQTFLAANDRIEGVWLWTQDGGPWRAGPLSLYLKEGFWQLADLNAYTAARLAWNPDADLGEATGDWIRATLSDDPATVAAVGEAMALSRESVLKGLYIGPYAEKQVFALGLEPPPMMWIFKWDIVSGDSAALSAVYFANEGRVDEAIAEGQEAVAAAQAMQAALADADPDSFHDAGVGRALVESVDYEVDLLQTLQAYRTMVLRYYEWLDTGSDAAHDAWREALPAYEEAVSAHLDRWTGDVEHPPYNFFAAEVGTAHAERGATGRVLGWMVLAFSLAALIAVPALRAGAFTPWRVHRAAPSPSTAQRILVVAAPVAAVVLSRWALSGGLSPWYLLITLGSLALLAAAAVAVLSWLRPGADPIWLWAALGGALLLRTVLLSGAVAFRGPLNYWYRLWVDPEARTVYVTVAFALFAWSFVALAVALVTAYGLRLRQGLGAVALGIGAPLVLLGGLLTAAGVERGLTALNDQMAILPLGLSRILGLTVHLGIPTALGTWLLVAGAVVMAVGALLSLGRRVRPGSHA